MDSVNKTLYIPLYGKAYVSGRNLFLRDEMAQRIWEKEGFPLKGKAKSKWLAYNMGMRAAVFDRWTQEQLRRVPDALVLHLGCGMDSRSSRVETGEHLWYDVDFPEVIVERKRYFPETETCRMLPADLREDWLDAVPGGCPAVVVMEGVSMYLTPGELNTLLEKLDAHFSSVRILMDTYTLFAAKATRYKNPINTVGVTQVYGFDDPEAPLKKTRLRFVAEHSLTPDDMLRQLPAGEQRFFRVMFAGKLAKKIYRLYEYQTEIG